MYFYRYLFFWKFFDFIGIWWVILCIFKIFGTFRNLHRGFPIFFKISLRLFRFFVFCFRDSSGFSIYVSEFLWTFIFRDSLNTPGLSLVFYFSVFLVTLEYFQEFSRLFGIFSKFFLWMSIPLVLVYKHWVKLNSIFVLVHWN